jgi:hypothetical protein
MLYSSDPTSIARAERFPRVRRASALVAQGRYQALPQLLRGRQQIRVARPIGQHRPLLRNARPVGQHAAIISIAIELSDCKKI